MRFIYFFIAVLTIGLASCSSTDDLGTSAESISIDRSAYTLVIGEYTTLVATVFPETALNKNVTWHSEDTQIATVDNNGRVTAVATGAVTIVARSVDGNHAVTSRITVRATPLPPVAVTGVTIGGGNSFLIVDVAARGGTVTRAANVLPATATNRNVTWSSSNPDVARVNAATGLITAASVGTATITVTTEDGGFTQSVNITVVDGAFIGGAIWARHNVDAPGTFTANQYDPGMLFQWNRRTGWAAAGTVTGWDNTTPTGAEWRAPNNPCPAGWRLPTNVELNALVNVPGVWTTEGGVSGRRFTVPPPSNHTIFLPAAGWRNSSGALTDAGTLGMYWSGVPHLSSVLARGLRFDDYRPIAMTENRANGFSVRCVANN